MQIVDAADSIAYDTHDADDALELGLLKLDEVIEQPLWRDAAVRVRKKYAGLTGGRLRRAVLQPRMLSHQEFADYIAASEAMLLPYRKITGSAEVKARVRNVNGAATRWSNLREAAFNVECVVRGAWGMVRLPIHDRQRGDGASRWTARRRGGEAAAKGRSFPLILFVKHDSHASLCRQLAEDIARAIGASVIDDNDFAGKARVEHALDDTRDGVGFVETRDHDRQHEVFGQTDDSQPAASIGSEQTLGFAD